MRIVPLGREEESSSIYIHISEAINNKEYGTLYVSGMPGCGKTLTCSSILHVIKEKYKNVSVVEVNCGSLVLPSDIFLEVHRQLIPAAKSSSARVLEEVLKQREYTVMLIDEIDMLINKGQLVLYCLLEIPSQCKNVYLISISNTYNLPDKKLSLKVRSRLGWNRINFSMYKKAHIMGILSETKTPIPFTEEALNYCASRISSLNGDIRKAMQIQKYAGEHAEKAGLKKVDLKEVDAAIKYVFRSMKGNFIRALSEYQKILLLIIAQKGYCYPNNIYEGFKRALSEKRLPLISFKEFEALLDKMYTLGVLKGRSNSLAVETDYVPEELEIMLSATDADDFEIIVES